MGNVFAASGGEIVIVAVSYAVRVVTLPLAVEDDSCAWR